jgi:hypothetical protein
VKLLNPNTKILMLRNLITDYCASGFSAGQSKSSILTDKKLSEITTNNYKLITIS